MPLDGSGGSSVRVMAGTSTHGGVAGPIKMRNPGLLMDVRLAAGDNFTQEVPEVSRGAAGCGVGVWRWLGGGRDERMQTSGSVAGWVAGGWGGNGVVLGGSSWWRRMSPVPM